jgi:hypothetical protein
MSAVKVAEYITAWIMEILKADKENFILAESLLQQSWLYVAKTNCVHQDKITAATDINGSTAGRHKIPLKV